MENSFTNSLVDTWVITSRNLKRYVRLPQLLVFSSIQPVMFLLLFNYVFGGALGLSIAVPGGRYINYLLPGILVQVVLFGGVQTGIGLSEDMNKGIIDRFKSLPMSRAAVVAGRTLSDTIRNVGVIAIMLIVGYLIGFRFHGGLGYAILMYLVALLFGFAFSWVFGFVGLTVKDSETAQLASFFFIFPLTFASAAFVPIYTMPSWMQGFARHQPVTLAVQSIRHYALGIPANGSTWQLMIWVGAILALFVPLSIWKYKQRTN